MRRLTVAMTMAFGILVVAACASAPTLTPVVPTTALPTAASTAPPQDQPAATPSVATTGAGTVVAFHILPDQSEARFLIDEVFGGEPKTVVGATSDVSGDISGDFAAPQTVQVGPIQVDMSTLRTDNSFRNRALHDFILSTGSEANRFAVFQLTGIEGLPAEVSFGTAYPLSLTGDLTLHGVSRTVTFDATVTPISAARLEGTASVSSRIATSASTSPVCRPKSRRWGTSSPCRSTSSPKPRRPQGAHGRQAAVRR